IKSNLHLDDFGVLATRCFHFQNRRQLLAVQPERDLHRFVTYLLAENACTDNELAYQASRTAVIETALAARERAEALLDVVPLRYEEERVRLLSNRLRRDDHDARANALGRGEIAFEQNWRQ